MLILALAFVLMLPLEFSRKRFLKVLNFSGADQTHSKLSPWGDEYFLLSSDPVTHITDRQCSCRLSGHTRLCLSDVMLLSAECIQPIVCVCVKVKHLASEYQCDK